MDYAIVLLSYNHETLTGYCLNSVLNAGFPAEQIYLVHNGSQSNKVQLLKDSFPKVQHLLLKENLGYSGGANFGLRSVFQKYENILFLTNDTEVIQLPKNFPTGKNFFSVPIYVRNTNRLHSTMAELNTTTGVLSHLETTDLPPSPHIRYIPGTAFGITKNIFQHLQGFDEAFHTYWEDVDLSYRATQAGFSLSFDSTFSLKHKIGKTCHKNRFYTLYLYQRNRRWFMQKHQLTNFKFYVTYARDLSRLFFRLMKSFDLQSSTISDLNYLRRVLHEKYKPT